MPKRLWVAGVSSLLAAAGCSSDRELAPLLPSCTATTGTPVNLGVAAYKVVDLTQTAGCAVFPANPSASAAIRYLVVPQSASPTPNESQAYVLRGNPLAAPLAAPALARTAPLGAARQFDLTLRRAEREAAAQLPRPLLAPPRAAAALTPLDLGDVRSFKVCRVLVGCDPRRPSTLVSVTATAQEVGTHIAIFVDDAAPQPGLTQADLSAFRTVFDTRLYELDTLAFGAESDIDNNGKVIVLMTGRVNALVPIDSCAQGFVVGYFFGLDLITTGPFTTGNNGEIFYSIVPDPGATLSCAHSVSQVKQLVPPTFVHEFQHMISFNQHFLLPPGGPAEDLWLNEGLSHYAEELGGRSFLPGDSVTFCQYVAGDLVSAGLYFSAPQSHFLVDTAGIGGQPERGAYWLFVRYLVDRFAVGPLTPDSITRRLVMTHSTGAANVSTATRTPFETVVEQWALANYMSDYLPGFPTPPELQYVSWKFRSAFPRLHTTCSNAIPAELPLTPVPVSASAVNASGTLRAGSGAYYIAQQDPSALEFTLQVNGFDQILFARYQSLLRTTLVPRLNVIRLQ